MPDAAAWNRRNRPDLRLAEAVAIITEVRVARLLAGDAGMAARLAGVVDELHVEGEVIEGIVVHGYIAPAQLPARCEPARALGWWLRHDPVIRAVRDMRGLKLPDLPAREVAA